MMKIYRCPICRKRLTKKEFENALGIIREREKHVHEREEDLRRRLQESQQQEKSARAGGLRKGWERAKRHMQGQERAIDTLRERIRQLRRGSTAQTEGLEFEDKLAARLRKQFEPEDRIIHKGKGGDVLHIVRFNGRPAGMIVYECKREKRIKPKHIRQAYLAKQQREADFAVLVTTGYKKGFAGLAQMDNVLVVSPLGTIPLAGLLRLHLIEMLRARVTKKRRAIMAEKLMKFIVSPQFKNPIERITQSSADAQDVLKNEMKVHRDIWERRWEIYQTMYWDASGVRENVQLVLHGKEPKAIMHPKAPPLQLPASTD